MSAIATQWISLKAFDQYIFNYRVNLARTSGTLSTTGITSLDATEKIVLKATSERLVPGRDPGISTLLFGVRYIGASDGVYHSGFINPLESRIFGPLTEHGIDKSSETVGKTSAGVNTNGDVICAQVSTFGNIYCGLSFFCDGPATFYDQIGVNGTATFNGLVEINGTIAINELTATTINVGTITASNAMIVNGAATFNAGVVVTGTTTNTVTALTAANSGQIITLYASVANQNYILTLPSTATNVGLRFTVIVQQGGSAVGISTVSGGTTMNGIMQNGGSFTNVSGAHNISIAADATAGDILEIFGVNGESWCVMGRAAGATTFTSA